MRYKHLMNRYEDADQIVQNLKTAGVHGHVRIHRDSSNRWTVCYWIEIRVKLTDYLRARSIVRNFIGQWTEF